MKSAGWNDEATQRHARVRGEPGAARPLPVRGGLLDRRVADAVRLRAQAQGGRAHAARSASSAKEDGAPQSCGFVLPAHGVQARDHARRGARTTCATGKTELLTDFTSRFGRPFSATLVLKDNGRHGFEFPPRKRAGEDERRRGRGARGRQPLPPRRARSARAKKAPAGAEKPAAAAKAPRKKAPRKKKAARRNRPLWRSDRDLDKRLSRLERWMRILSVGWGAPWRVSVQTRTLGGSRSRSASWSGCQRRRPW